MIRHSKITWKAYLKYSILDLYLEFLIQDVTQDFALFKSPYVTQMVNSLMAQMVKNLPSMRTPGFDPWVGKMPWRRDWPPIPVFLPGEYPWQRSLADCSPLGPKESARLSGDGHCYWIYHMGERGTIKGFKSEESCDWYQTAEKCLWLQHWG